MKKIIIPAVLLFLIQPMAVQADVELAYDDGDPNLELQFALDGAR